MSTQAKQCGGTVCSWQGTWRPVAESHTSCTGVAARAGAVSSAMPLSWVSGPLCCCHAVPTMLCAVCRSERDATKDCNTDGSANVSIFNLRWGAARNQLQQRSASPPWLGTQHVPSACCVSLLYAKGLSYGFRMPCVHTCSVQLLTASCSAHIAQHEVLPYLQVPAGVDASSLVRALLHLASCAVWTWCSAPGLRAPPAPSTRTWCQQCRRW